MWYNDDVVFRGTQYLPFYGGAKGQYLEIKINNRGSVVGEKIVSEENISSENVVKNTEENLISKVLGANLQSLKTLSTSVLKLHNFGRKTGGLSASDTARFKSELASLGETASNTIKLIEEVGDNVEVIFKNNASKLKYDHDEDVSTIIDLSYKYVYQLSPSLRARVIYPDGYNEDFYIRDNIVYINPLIYPYRRCCAGRHK